MKVIVNDVRCQECGRCVGHCPRQAIGFEARVNQKGYRTVVLDQDKCTACGMCYITCPDGVYEIVG